MQNENLFFFSFSSESTFGEAKGTNKQAKNKRKPCFSLHGLLFIGEKAELTCHFVDDLLFAFAGIGVEVFRVVSVGR